MTHMPCPYDEIWIHDYNLNAPEVANLHDATSTTYSQVPPTTLRPYALHSYDPIIRLPNPSTTLHYNQLHPSPIVHPSYPLLLAEGGSLDDTSINYRNLGSFHPSDTQSTWGPFQPSPNLFSTAPYGVPALHSTLNPALRHRRQSSLSAADIGVGFMHMDEYIPVPNYYQPSPPTSGTSCLPPTEYPFACSEAPSASYPCLWTEGDTICNAMVQATRSHVNRHLHTHHGFGGSDTRQSKCRWAGCGETMQQGSIARHMVTCHLRVKVTCPMCFKKLSRQDVISKHQRICPAAGAWR